MERQNMIFFCGYIIHQGVDMNEYWDFVRKYMNLDEVKRGLELGVFPPGLIMKDNYNNIAIVDCDRKTLKKLIW